MARKPLKGAAPKERTDVLLRTRHSKMARNAHAYVRGSTAKFYEWLEVQGGKLPGGPSVWICGDCHLGSLGPLADAKGNVDVQIRDLDQTVIEIPPMTLCAQRPASRLHIRKFSLLLPRRTSTSAYIFN
jgi:uncharacterized protein (DUF2252 family)